MSLVPPILDDRKFDELRAEAIERIQREFPQWTDHNVSDPGITLIELFAWFTELTLYRMNQLPDKLHGELLHLVGVRPNPAHAAKAIIEFRPDPQKNDGKPELPLPVALIARHTQSERVSVDDKEVAFETEQDLAVVRRPLVAIRRRVGNDVHDLTLLNDLADRGFDPFGPSGAKDSELQLRIRAHTDDRPDDVFPEILTLHAAIVEPPIGSRPAVVASTDPDLSKAQTARQSAAKLVWEVRLDDADSAPQWERLEIVSDETASFARDGFIRLGRPRHAAAHSDDDGKSHAFELRCRVQEAFALGRAPRLRHLAINAVTARAYSTERELDLGVSNGLSGQTFTLRKQPVEAGSLRLVTRKDEKNPGDTWKEVADFANAGPDALEFMLDLASGRITFGDGVHGKIPESGQRVVALSYRSGGGSVGNLDAKAIKFSKPGKFTGTNPLAAGGGRDGETPASARQRAPARLRSRDRAVTAGDYAEIARGEGGMARALAVPGLHPDFPELKGQMPGALTVFVVAPLLKDNRAPPWPSNLELAEVERVLDERRIIGSEVHVRSAHIIPVQVTVTARRAPGVDAEKAVAAIRTALNDWLNDSARGFGTRIYAADIWSAVSQAKVHDTMAVQQIARLNVKVEGLGDLDLLTTGDEDEKQGDLADAMPHVAGGDPLSPKISIKLPAHAVPWGPRDHRVFLVEDER